jgi:acetone carboxylase gamma subunit
MKVFITEYLQIDLGTEMWECRVCKHEHISARENYKKGLLINPRDPREIHKPLINAEQFEYTFAPDPEFCVLYEFYCPSCGTLVETEYQVPGHLPTHDIELDIDALKVQWKDRDESAGPDMGPDTDFLPGEPHCHH